MRCPRIKVLAAATLEAARKVVEKLGMPLHSVEAEYGGEVIEGKERTLAHHQKAGRWSKARPAPCCAEAIPAHPREEGYVLVSHLDLDTVGGVAALLGYRDDVHCGVKDHVRRIFWTVVQEVDLRGPHFLRKIVQQVTAEEATRRGLDLKDKKVADTCAAEQAFIENAMYAAWAKARTFPRIPRDGDGVVEVTGSVLEHAEAINTVLGKGSGHEALMQAGADFRSDGMRLSAETYGFRQGRVLMRLAKAERQFVNHLYVVEDIPGLESHTAPAVVGLSVDGAVTVSLAEPVEGVSCRDIVQSLWGSDAGGHDGIAGSPRGKVMNEQDWFWAGLVLDKVLDKIPLEQAIAEGKAEADKRAQEWAALLAEKPAEEPKPTEDVIAAAGEDPVGPSEQKPNPVEVAVAAVDSATDKEV